ncbi:MAG: undecaprenyl phosphate translocase family protein, partial [Desulfobacterales bacterium]
TLKNPFDPVNAGIILVFVAGCGLGLAGFSRILKYLLDAYHNLTLAFLTGLMVGSMRKIWPWKETLEAKMVGGELRVLREKNVMPGAFDTDLLLALALMLVGFVFVICLERFSREKAVG